VTFPREYTEKLFNLFDVDKNKQITLYIILTIRQEFITSYMLLEEKLRLKNIKLQKVHDDLQITRDKFHRGMLENKEEKFNENGISTTAAISVTLLEAKNLKPMNLDGFSDPYVKLSVDNEKTEWSSFKLGTLNPIWNEDFSLNVHSRNSILRIEVYSKRKFGGDDFIGGTTIGLKGLDDQQKVDKWFKLSGEGLNDENGQVRLRLQFVWSKFKFFEENYQKTVHQIETLEEDFTEINRLLGLLDRPFGLLIFGEINNIIEKRILDRADELGHYLASSRKSVYASPRFTHHVKHGITERVENVFRATFKGKTFLTKGSKIEWSRWSMLLMYIICILSCLNIFYRTDFVNVITI
jgi:hypothetical protein